MISRARAVQTACLVLLFGCTISFAADELLKPATTAPATAPTTLPIKNTPAKERPVKKPRPVPAVKGVEHVVIIGIDGLSVDGVRRGAGPNLKRFMTEGAYTLNARAMIPTVSGPNWTSIMCSAPPSYHGVTNNEWTPEKHPVDPIAKGPGGIFPTLYSVLWEQDTSAVSGMICEWKTMAILIERELVDHIENHSDTPRTASAAANWFKSAKPRLMMVHLDTVDHAGHGKGWGTPPYIEAVGEADAGVGTVLASIREAGLEASTLVFIVTDHGGKNKSHGGLSIDELAIPWMVMGPGVQAGEIKSVVCNAHTAATAVWALGLTAPESWTQKPVKSAFK